MAGRITLLKTEINQHTLADLFVFIVQLTTQKKKLSVTQAVFPIYF
jgi:hypothetical protein